MGLFYTFQNWRSTLPLKKNPWKTVFPTAINRIIMNHQSIGRISSLSLSEYYLKTKRMLGKELLVFALQTYRQPNK